MITNFSKTEPFAFAAALVAVAGLGTSSALVAQTPSRATAQANSALPPVIARAAIATRSRKSGSIAGARIGNSNHFVVYINTPSGCGSGGCRAQIWTLNGNRPVHKGSIAVGKLPIVLLNAVDNGMPRIGVTTTTSDNRLAILPITFDGNHYSGKMHNNLLVPTAGRPIVTWAMLRPY